MISRRWRGRRASSLSLLAALAVAVGGPGTTPIAAHSPDPALGTGLFAQDARATTTEATATSEPEHARQA